MCAVIASARIVHLVVIKSERAAAAAAAAVQHRTGRITISISLQVFVDHFHLDRLVFRNPGQNAILFQ